MTLDELSPDDLEQAERACDELWLPRRMPDRFRERLAARLAELDRPLARRLLRMPRGELRVLYDYLLDRQAGAGALALGA